MAAYIVTYDLMKQGQNYDCIIKKLESYETHWHMQQSVWLIETNQNPEEISNLLSSCLDNNDKLFVGGLSGEAAWNGYDKDIDDWLMGLLQ